MEGRKSLTSVGESVNIGLDRQSCDAFVRASIGLVWSYGAREWSLNDGRAKLHGCPGDLSLRSLQVVVFVFDKEVYCVS